jgi:N-acetyl-anhydromuramyl-L-alanine amidase AmpD
MDKKMNRPMDTRTEAQKKSLLTLIRTYKARYPGIIIRGHRDWSPDLDGDGVIEPNEWKKACPSFDVVAWLKETGDLK